MPRRHRKTPVVNSKEQADMARDLEVEFDAIKEDVSALRSDLAALLETVSQRGRTRLRESVEEAGDRLDELASRARDASQQGVDDLSDHIASRPLSSVLLAFGLGTIIGRLLK